MNEQHSARPSSPNHQRWLAETWQMIEECAAATKGDRRRTVVTLSPEGCSALMAERLGHETSEVSEEMRRRMTRPALLAEPVAMARAGTEQDLKDLGAALKANEEPPVLGSGTGPAPMPTVDDAIAAHVREIQILCDASGRDPTQWLNDEAAGGCL